MTTTGGAQGYLFVLPEKAADFILRLINWDGLDTKVEANDTAIGLNKNSATKIRIGQTLFRNRLKKYWNYRCAVTGSQTLEMLRASHIVPWSAASPKERVNVYNGFLLSPTYDAAFDKNLISFSDEGNIIFSKNLKQDEIQRLGLRLDARLRKIEKPHVEYLTRHRAKLQTD